MPYIARLEQMGCVRQAHGLRLAVGEYEMSITPGSLVTLEITARPTSEAARKTLVRVCRKDADVHRRYNLRKRKRPSWQEWRRGGRMWHHQMKSLPMAIEKGASYTVRATVDVIRDLESVARFVTVNTK